MYDFGSTLAVVRWSMKKKNILGETLCVVVVVWKNHKNLFPYNI